MKNDKLLEAYINSLDQPVSDSEQKKLEALLQNDAVLKNEKGLHDKVRSLLSVTEKQSFGPYFANKVLAKLEQREVALEDYVFSFFNRYKLVAIGSLMLLFILNTALSDQGTLKEVFGLRTSVTTEDEIVSFDYYQLLNEGI